MSSVSPASCFTYLSDIFHNVGKDFLKVEALHQETVTLPEASEHQSVKSEAIESRTQGLWTPVLRLTNRGVNPNSNWCITLVRLLHLSIVSNTKLQ